VENKLEKINIPAIWETEEEKNLSIGQLKYRYLRVAKQKFQGKVFINRDIKKPIRISKDGIMEWWRKSRKREHIISVQFLDFFLENGIFRGESPDYLSRSKIISASQFESMCEINGKSFIVIVTTRKALYDIDKYLYFALKDIETA